MWNTRLYRWHILLYNITFRIIYHCKRFELFSFLRTFLRCFLMVNVEKGLSLRRQMYVLVCFNSFNQQKIFFAFKFKVKKGNEKKSHRLFTNFFHSPLSSTQDEGRKKMKIADFSEIFFLTRWNWVWDELLSW